MYKSLQAIKLDVQRPVLFFIGFILARGGQASKTSYTEWGHTMSYLWVAPWWQILWVFRYFKLMWRHQNTVIRSHARVLWLLICDVLWWRHNILESQRANLSWFEAKSIFLWDCQVEETKEVIYGKVESQFILSWKWYQFWNLHQKNKNNICNAGKTNFRDT